MDQVILMVRVMKKLVVLVVDHTGVVVNLVVLLGGNDIQVEPMVLVVLDHMLALTMMVPMEMVVSSSLNTSTKYK